MVLQEDIYVGKINSSLHDLLESVSNCVSSTGNRTAVVKTPPSTIVIYIFSDSPRRYLRSAVQLRPTLYELGWRGYSPTG